VEQTTAMEFLRTRFGATAQITVMRPGEWSAAYGVRTADADLVARFSAYDEDFEKDEYAARYSSEALPIPTVVERDAIEDGFYAFSERMPGQHIDGLDEVQMRRLLPSLFRALDAMRSIDLSAGSGFGGWRAGGTAARATWRDSLLAIGTGPGTRGSPGARALLRASPAGVAPFDAGYAELRELVEHCPEIRHLVHDDLLNFNVLVEGEQISAVLDWGSSKYGDFLYDLAKFIFYQPWYEAWRSIDFVTEARAHYAAIGLDVPHLSERLTCYCVHIGLADMAYSAYRERWEQADANARRISEILRT